MENNMVKIAASLLAADFSDLKNEIKRASEAGCEYLHLDVMDGVFVPNISFGSCVIKTLRPHSEMVFDTHLMIIEPERYIEKFADAGSDIITFHYESTKNVGNVIDLIHSFNKKAGISIKPATPVEVLFPYIEKLDMVLIMSVEPGFGGQAFMNDMLEKISALRKEIDRLGLKTDIQVDGGINKITSAYVRKAGADIIVCGTAIFNAEDMKKEVELIRG